MSTKTGSWKIVVAEAKSRDMNRGIIRLHMKLMDALDIKTGDVVKIQGERTTVATAWPDYPQDAEKCLVRIDEIIRLNAGVNVDAEIKLEKADLVPANKILLLPLNSRLKSDSRFEDFMKRKLLNKPLACDDIVQVTIGINKFIKFKVVEMKPKAFTILRQSTVVLVGETPVHDPRSESLESHKGEFMQKLEKLLAVSTRIEFRFLKDYLGIAKRDFNERIVDWAYQFNFKIDGNTLVVDGGDKNGFIAYIEANYLDLL